MDWVFNRSLENIEQTRTYQIQERTEQLEMAHERLATSMRENAEALAEAMILEERYTLQKRIIFQTLQEGLSIGIKHGYGALNRFRILINSDQEAIRIQLIHLGHAHPLEDIGFGLHAAAEHVSLLGGTIEAESEAGGFVLTLTLPLMGAVHWVI